MMQDIRRTAVSWLLAVVAVILSVVYAIPGMGIARTLPEGRTSVVSFLDPTWTIVFGATGILLMTGLLRRTWMVVSHTLGVATFSFWSAAVLIGSVMSDPPAPMTAAVLGFAITVLHFWSVVDYAGD